MLLTVWKTGLRFVPMWRWLFGLAIFAGALVAHGCHGKDVDHELCAPSGPAMHVR